MHELPLRGLRNGACACGQRRSRGRLSPRRPVREAAPADGRMGEALRSKSHRKGRGTQAEGGAMSAKKTATKISGVITTRHAEASDLRKMLRSPAPTKQERREGALFGINAWADEKLPTFTLPQLGLLL